MTLQIGDALPDIKVFEYIDDGSHPEGPKGLRLPDLAYKKKIMIISIIGAFTPVCSDSQMPGFIDQYDQFLKKGLDEIWCISTNDPFVMWAWAERLGARGKIKMLSDGSANLATLMDMTLDLTNHGMGVRSDRYAMIVDNGVITDLVQEDSGRLCYTSAEALIESL